MRTAEDVKMAGTIAWDIRARARDRTSVVCMIEIWAYEAILNPIFEVR